MTAMRDGNVLHLRQPADRSKHEAALRVAEAAIFASPRPVTADELRARLPEGTDADAVIDDLRRRYGARGINLVAVAGGWAFRTAPDLAAAIRPADTVGTARLSRAATEVLAVIAYHQPATRADIESIRGVATSKGTLDLLIEAGWVGLRARREAPGRPNTYGTTPAFLDQFGLAAISDLPGLDELRALGFWEDGGAAAAIPRPGDDLLPEVDEPPEPDLALGPSGADEA